MNRLQIERHPAVPSREQFIRVWLLACAFRHAGPILLREELQLRWEMGGPDAPTWEPSQQTPGCLEEAEKVAGYVWTKSWDAIYNIPRTSIRDRLYPVGHPVRPLRPANRTGSGTLLWDVYIDGSVRIEARARDLDDLPAPLPIWWVAEIPKNSTDVMVSAAATVASGCDKGGIPHMLAMADYTWERLREAVAVLGGSLPRNRPYAGEVRVMYSTPSAEMPRSRYTRG